MAINPKDRKEKGELREQLLVQCPACQTKFGVDSSLVGEFAVPRFHCSRCDHVFEVEHYRLFPRLDKAPEQVSPIIQKETVNALGGDLASMSSSFSAPSRGLSVPRTFDPSMAIAAPHEHSDGEQMRLDLNVAPRSASHSAESSPYGGTGSVPGWQLGGAEDFTASTAEIKIEGDAWDEEFSPLREKPVSSWQGFVWIAGPVIVALTLCVFLGYAVISRPSLGVSLFAGAFSASPKAPPAGVILEETEVERVTLESGDSLYALRAVLKNGSNERVKGLVVEGALFDREGQILVQRRVPANSTLARTRIKSLTLEMVEDLQAREHTKALLLDPGERHEVLIALPQPPGSSIESFVARVYSVG